MLPTSGVPGRNPELAADALTVAGAEAADAVRDVDDVVGGDPLRLDHLPLAVLARPR